jgi:hypothetical protein
MNATLALQTMASELHQNQTIAFGIHNAKINSITTEQTMAIAIQIVDVIFDPTDTEPPLSLQRVQEIQDDIRGHVFELDSDPDDVEQLEYDICEEVTSETGLLVQSFSYLVISAAA